MVKLVEIHECIECPYSRQRYDTFYCDKEDGCIVNDAISTFPQWCPLLGFGEEAEELVKDMVIDKRYKLKLQGTIHKSGAVTIEGIKYGSETIVAQEIRNAYYHKIRMLSQHNGCERWRGI